jgi:hypothetical protein
MSVDAALSGLNARLDTIAGLHVHANPPESLNEFPCSITYMSSGEMTQASHGLARSLHTLVAEIYIQRTLLPQAMDEARMWPDAIYAALAADQTLGGAVDHIVWPLRYVARPASYGNIESVFYTVRFEVTVKVIEV